MPCAWLLQVYEPIDDRNLHYIKLIDMVTGRGHMVSGAIHLDIHLNLNQGYAHV
jgi:hypothetical protein